MSSDHQDERAARAAQAVADLEKELKSFESAKCLFDAAVLAKLAYAKAHAPAAFGRFMTAVATAKLPGYSNANLKAAIAAEVTRQREEGRAASGNVEASSRPVISLTNRPHREAVADTVAAVVGRNHPATLLRMGSNLVRVDAQHEGRAAAVLADEAVMRLLISDAAEVMVVTRDGLRHCDPPRALVQGVMASAELIVPTLRAIVRSPMIRADGSVLSQPGYDAASEFFYDPDPSLIVPAISSAPTRTDVQQALRLLREPFAEFTWADASGEAHALALLLTVVLRNLVVGPCPLFVINATCPGTGKGLLISLITSIAIGRPLGCGAPPTDREEWLKTIPALLMGGEPIIVLDNAAGSIGSPALDSVLTAYPEYATRPFGKNDRVMRAPTHAVWIANGNNVLINGDLQRRVVKIDLLPSPDNPERPWEARFRRSEHELHAYVSAHRGELIAAVLTLARAWKLAGEPHDNGPLLGSFNAWCRVVGGILGFVGVDGFMTNRHEAFAESDETVEDAAFLVALSEYFGGEEFTVPKVLKAMYRMEVGEHPTRHVSPPGDFIDALPSRLQLARDRGRGNLGAAMGRLLLQYRGRVLPGGYRVERTGRDPHQKVAVWKIRRSVPAQAREGAPSGASRARGPVATASPAAAPRGPVRKSDKGVKRGGAIAGARVGPVKKASTPHSPAVASPTRAPGETLKTLLRRLRSGSGAA